MNRPLPVPDTFSQRYWNAALAGDLLVQRCDTCDRYQHYPRPHCSHCLAQDPSWVKASGTGHIYSFTIVRRTPNEGFADETPYVFALVDLDEGVRISTNVVGWEEEELACGQRVRMEFEQLGQGIALPVARVVNA